MTHGVPIRVDHVGIAVESIAAAEPVLTPLGTERFVAEDAYVGGERVGTVDGEGEWNDRDGGAGDDS